MFTIDRDSDLYTAVSGSVACVIGFGASILIRGFCNNMIDIQEPTGMKKGLVKAGAFGLEELTCFAVARKIKSDIDDFVDGYNELANAYNAYQAVKPVENEEDVVDNG